MLENSVYSVISPEGCAAIQWKDAKASASGPRRRSSSPRRLLRLKIIDEIVKEPVPARAHRPDTHTRGAARRAHRHVHRALRKDPPRNLVRRLREKYAAMGAYSEA